MDKRDIAKEILGREPIYDTEIDLCMQIHELQIENNQLRDNGKVIPLNISSGDLKLIKVARDNKLKRYMLVCTWENGDITTNWSDKFPHEQLSLCLTLLEKRVKEEIAGNYDG